MGFNHNKEGTGDKFHTGDINHIFRQSNRGTPALYRVFLFKTRDAPILPESGLCAIKSQQST